MLASQRYRERRNPSQKRGGQYNTSSSSSSEKRQSIVSQSLVCLYESITFYLLDRQVICRRNVHLYQRRASRDHHNDIILLPQFYKLNRSYPCHNNSGHVLSRLNSNIGHLIFLDLNNCDSEKLVRPQDNNADSRDRNQKTTTKKVFFLHFFISPLKAHLTKVIESIFLVFKSWARVLFDSLHSYQMHLSHFSV